MVNPPPMPIEFQGVLFIPGGGGVVGAGLGWRQLAGNQAGAAEQGGEASRGGSPRPSVGIQPGPPRRSPCTTMGWAEEEKSSAEKQKKRCRMGQRQTKEVNIQNGQNHDPDDASCFVLKACMQRKKAPETLSTGPQSEYGCSWHTLQTAPSGTAKTRHFFCKLGKFI